MNDRSFLKPKIEQIRQFSCFATKPHIIQLRKAVWLSGKMLECCGFEPQRRHCVVTLILAKYMFNPDITEKTVGWDVKNQIKQNFPIA